MGAVMGPRTGACSGGGGAIGAGAGARGGAPRICGDHGYGSLLEWIGSGGGGGGGVWDIFRMGSGEGVRAFGWCGIGCRFALLHLWHWKLRCSTNFWASVPRFP